jgi:hypothetical protein
MGHWNSGIFHGPPSKDFVTENCKKFLPKERIRRLREFEISESEEYRDLAGRRKLRNEDLFEHYLSPYAT